MIKVLLSGACGKMGKVITENAADHEDIRIVCGVDIVQGFQRFPVYSSFADVPEKPDVIIDFSNIAVLDGLLEYAVNEGIPAVLATTGYNEVQREKIRQAADSIPIFYTANMSLGVNLLCALAKKAAVVLGNDFDIEIIEKHHNQKIDAPSGTALMLADAINDVSLDRYNYEYDRHSKRRRRTKNEIGIHSVRGGTIVGEHSILFAGKDELITLSHSAASKSVFANGALKAAVFISEKKSGIYDMNDMLSF